MEQPAGSSAALWSKAAAVVPRRSVLSQSGGRGALDCLENENIVTFLSLNASLHAQVKQLCFSIEVTSRETPLYFRNLWRKNRNRQGLAATKGDTVTCLSENNFSMNNYRVVKTGILYAYTLDSACKITIFSQRDKFAALFLDSSRENNYLFSAPIKSLHAQVAVTALTKCLVYKYFCCTKIVVHTSTIFFADRCCSTVLASSWDCPEIWSMTERMVKWDSVQQW